MIPIFKSTAIRSVTNLYENTEDRKWKMLREQTIAKIIANRLKWRKKNMVIKHELWIFFFCLQRN